MAKTKTLDQLEAMRQKAVRFLEDVVGDSDKADEFDDMSTEDYAAHKGITVKNPRLSPSINYKGEIATMASQLTRAQLLERVSELEDENEDLTDRLDSISAIVGDDDDEDEDDEDDDEDR